MNKQLEDFIKIHHLYDLNCLKHSTFHEVYSCISDSLGKVILKYNGDEIKALREYLFLKQCSNSCCPSVFAYDNGCLLEEQVNPGTTLRNETSLDNRINAYYQACSLLHHSTVDNKQFPLYSDWLFNAYEYVTKNVDNQIFYEHAKMAYQICFEMYSLYPDLMFLHGDLHHDNILMYGSDSYVAIDPKGAVGPEILEFGRFILNELPMVEEYLVESHIIQVICGLSTRFNYPISDIVKVFYMETVLASIWNIEDGEAICEKELRVAEKLMITYTKGKD